MPVSDSTKSNFASIVSLFVSRDLARRDLALDALRGLMILGMVMVNHPPPTTELLAPFVHAAWHGWTVADVVAPGFLFCVGVSIRLAMVEPSGEPVRPTARLYGKVFRRFVLLMLLNFGLLNFPYFELGKLQFSGTLATIAWCYAIAVLIHLHSGWRVQCATALFFLVFQWALYTFLPVPGVGQGVMTPEGNAARFIDHLLLEPLFGLPSDADRNPLLLPIFGSVTTTMIGLLAGQWIRHAHEMSVRVVGLFVIGLCLLVLGSLLQAVMPISKSLWTVTYTSFMAGVAMTLLATFYLIADNVGVRAYLKPLQIAGVNALFLYVFAQSLQRVLVYGRIRGDDGTPVRLRYFIYEHYFLPWLPGRIGVLIFTLLFLAICYAVVLALYRKRIFIKL